MRRLCVAVLSSFRCASIFCYLLTLCCASLPAQNAPVPAESAAALGYSYTLPPDWTVIKTKQMPQPSPGTVPLLPRKGTACTNVAETAKHGDPASVIVVVDLPFDCFGQVMTEGDLAGFGSGAADGMKQDFDLKDVLSANYSLSGHPFWVERAKGNPKGRTQEQYTVEIACSLLKKGAVCWMAMAVDEASLRVFEQTPVELDGEASTPLVPATAFTGPPAAN
jgi:hypothetical protein